MPLFQIITLAIIQGVTEFLPVSSSGHLVITSDLLGWKDQGLMIDVGVHIGTLGAVIFYLREDLKKMVWGVLTSTQGKKNDGAALVKWVFIASLPVFLSGFLVAWFIQGGLRNPAIIGWAFIIFGVLLYLSDKYGYQKRSIQQMSWKDALKIGLAQALAIIPGTSRAGVTITMARFLGYDRRESARFSMLLSVPAILGAATLLGLDLSGDQRSFFEFSTALAAGISFLTALIAIYLMMGWLRRQTYTPFVLYRVLMGVFILFLAEQI
ncbi:MAG: undecaprenyl-diphosphate phosphatase [Rhodospirillaceae bacterium]